MTKFALGLGALTIATTIGLAQSGGSSTDEVLRAVRAEGDAIVRHGAAAFDRLHTDGYLYVHSTGVVADKAADVKADASADTKWTSITFDDLKARIYGDAAIVTGIETLVGTAKGYVPGPRRFTDVWVKQNDSWLHAGGAGTLVSKGQSDNTASSALKSLQPKSIQGSTADERAVLQRDNAYMKAELANDDPGSQAMQTKDFSFVSRIGDLASPGGPPGPVEKTLIVAYARIRVYGTLALVQGSLLWSDDKAFSPGVLRFVRIWVKDGSAWKVAAEQRTPVASRATP